MRRQRRPLHRLRKTPFWNLTGPEENGTTGEGSTTLGLKIHTPAGGDATFRQGRPVTTAVKGSCNCTEKHTELREEGRESAAAFRTPNYLHLESQLAYDNTPLLPAHVYRAYRLCVRHKNRPTALTVMHSATQHFPFSFSVAHVVTTLRGNVDPLRNLSVELV